MTEKAELNKRIRKAKANRQTRPDPSFKSVVGELAEQNGFRQLNVELPQLISADLILVKETDKDLSSTMFHFFKDVTLVEFKSENDDFTDEEVAVHLVRCLLLYAKNKPVTYNQMLELFVSAEKPDSVIEHFRAIGVELVQKEEWLLTYRFGVLDIAIVVCRLLPLEERYFFLLPFAPATSAKWHEFVTMMTEQGRFDILKILASLKPVEVALVVTQARNKMKVPPEKEAEVDAALGEFFDFLLERTKDNPEARRRLISSQLDKITMEDLVAEFSSEKLDALIKALVAEFSSEKLDALIKAAEERKKVTND